MKTSGTKCIRKVWRVVPAYEGGSTDSSGRSARASTVRVGDGEPGDELQVDFGKLGRIPDAETGRQRDLWALICVYASLGRSGRKYAALESGTAAMAQPVQVEGLGRL
jgi:hypothetical protein